MANILPDQIVNQVKQVFSTQLNQPVEILFFTRQAGCETCADTQQLLEELAGLSNQLHLTVYDIDTDAALAQKYNVDKTPGIVLAGREETQVMDFGVRFAGVPSGYAFSTLVNAIILVSGRDSRLQPMTRSVLKEIKKPVLLQVFSTPT